MSSEIKGLYDAPPSSSGVAVSEVTALNISAVWSAVQIIAGSIASLPLILYRRRPDGGKERYPEHPLYRILHDEPNPEMSSMVFRETLLHHVLLWGNGYAEIQRDQGGRVKALYPITPERVRPARDPAGRLYYEVTTVGKPVTKLDATNMFHVPGLGFDGTCGYSVVAKARESFGATAATERFASTYFGNSAIAGGILKHPRQLQQTTRDALKAQLDQYRGRGAYSTLLLEEGLDWVQTTIPPDDSQFLQTRKFQVTEVARWFNLPPHKLKDLERATFSNIEQQSLEFVIDTLRPWLVRIEQEIRRKLISTLERQIQYAEHLVDGLLRGDLASRYNAYAVGRQWGFLNVDDIRAFENMNPLPDGLGQIYIVPVNMMPAEQLGQMANLPELEALTPAPAAEAKEPEEEKASSTRGESVVSLPASTNGHGSSIPPPAAVEVREDPAPSPTLSPTPAPASTLSPSSPPMPTSMLPPAPASSPSSLPTPSLPPSSSPMPSPMPTPSPNPKLAVAHRAMVCEIVARMVRREAIKAQDRATKPERLRAWIAGFYPRHAEVFEVALLPAAQSHLAMMPGSGDPVAYVRQIVAEHIEESRAQLHALLDSQPANLLEAVTFLTERWEIERPGRIADRILQEELDHVHA
jgi:HK97 family phage portal protein